MAWSSGGSRRLGAPAHWLSICCLALAVPLHGAPSRSLPDTFEDFAVGVDDRGGRLIYALDSERGTLSKAPDDGREIWAPEAFQPLLVSVPHGRPTALAAAPQGGVVVAFQEPPAILWVPSSGEASLLWQGPPLERPHAVAAFGDGRLVIADAAPPGLFVLSHDSQEASPLSA